MGSGTPPNILGNASLSKFDVIVIGSGAGGGPMAYILTKSGLKVLVLEAGPNRFNSLDDAKAQPVPLFSNDELKNSNRDFITPDNLSEPRTFRSSTALPRSFVGDVNPLPKNVGGGAVHADLKTPRFEVRDFQLGTLLASTAPSGTSFADWPVDYTMLQPFYDYVETALGVQGLKGANPFESPRDDYPMKPGLEMYMGVLVGKGLAAVPSPRAPGHNCTAFPYPAAVNSQPYDGRPACVDCGFCSGYGCPSNAKGSPAVTMLRKALLSGNCQLLAQTRVVQLLTNGAKSSITGVVTIGPDGSKATYTADRYVLATSPIEDARILLLSDPGGSGLGNSSDQVGRNLTFHLQTVSLGIFEQRVHGHRGRSVATGFADFRGIAGSTTAPLGGIVEIGSAQFLIGEAQSYIQAFATGTPFTGAFFKNLMRQSPLRDHAVALTMHGEDAPQPTNRVDLDPQVVDLDKLPVARVTYANSKFELAASSFYSAIMLDVFGKAGARYAIVAPLDTVPTSAHIMGTLRFGNDSKTSVCDATGRFHDIGNLYACDGSLFPTSSGFNPTLTIVALSTWVAGNMVSPGSPEKVLSS
jgi:choline dehydrogenase-like flavoprotein